jgi:geranylgeranyl diphosphate synthase type II
MLEPGTEPPFDVDGYLKDCRREALAEIERFLPADREKSAGLYEMMTDYPYRPAKALRPALCIGTCLALGGRRESALPSAASFELFHNAFLVHDDVEDGSVRRRHAPTLHMKFGVPLAVNVGDAMLALALEPLLDNIRALGLGPALRILKSFARLARESVEGQAIELDWIRRRSWDLPDVQYLRMVHKKTAWYSFIAPLQVGAVCAGAGPALTRSLMRFAMLLGIAFQIQDDLLSLDPTAQGFGKDELGDLWEGKYTLALLHTLRSLGGAEKDEALAILALPGKAPLEEDQEEEASLRKHLLEKISRELPGLDVAERARLTHALVGNDAKRKRPVHVRRLYALVTGRGGASLEHARAIARRHAERAHRIFVRELGDIRDSVHKQFLMSLIDFVIHRAR